MAERLHLTRSQLATISKDPEIIKQLEKLFARASATSWDGSTILVDTLLDATGTTFAAKAPAPGVYRVTFTWAAAVVGGSGADGWQFIEADSADLDYSPFSWQIIGDEAGVYTSAAISSGNLSTLMSGAASAFFTMTAMVNVIAAGTFGITVRQRGAPTSATLGQSSGLSVAGIGASA